MNNMDDKLAKIYYSPAGYFKGVAAIKKLAAAAKVPEETAKQWLFKQALWQIYLPGPKNVPRPKFDVSVPNRLHQADLLFYRMTNYREAARFSNMLWLLLMRLAGTKRQNR